MKTKIARYLLWFALFSATITGGYLYYEFTRTNPRLKNVKADYRFDAVDLMKTFENDTAAANKKYMDQVIAVTGTVSKTDSNGNPVVIFMQHPEKLSSVKCSMDSTYKNEYINLQPGSVVTIKGICAGGEVLEFGLGTDVSLKRSVIEN